MAVSEMHRLARDTGGEVEVASSLERVLTVFTSQSCILCPNEGGAFKQTVLGDWVHLLCAIWIPETRVMNETFMEPITDADKIPKQRWKLVCRFIGSLAFN